MSIIIHSALCQAMESSILQVEASYLSGFSGLQLIGDTTEVTRGGLQRARAALENLPLKIPQKKILLNTIPADMKVDGNQFDLPFAVCLAVLINGQLPIINLNEWIFAAELGLDGTLRPVRGIVSIALEAVANNYKGVIIAKENLKEISILKEKLKGKGIDVKALGFSNLKEVLDWCFLNENTYTPLTCSSDQPPIELEEKKPNFDDMVLSAELEELAVVAATGLHSILLSGTPGGGKSMFSSRMTSILPPMENTEHIEALRIHSSFSDKISDPMLSGRPPFRSPHHQATPQAILGIPDKPGEVSLAHGGILFLDEFCEFRRDLIESLREPLETGFVSVSRAKQKVFWKSKIMLIAACNNCPCGWLGSQKHTCNCATSKILAYRQKLSGPILDRIDLHIDLTDKNTNTGSIMLKQHLSKGQTKKLSERVKKAREFAKLRNEKLKIVVNRDLLPENIEEASCLDPLIFQTLVEQFSKHQLTNRSFVKVWKVARTIADVRGDVVMSEEHLKQAILWSKENLAVRNMI